MDEKSDKPKMGQNMWGHFIHPKVASAMATVLRETGVRYKDRSATIAAAKIEARGAISKAMLSSKLSSAQSHRHVFDSTIYSQAKPLFQLAASHLQDSGQDIREVMRAIIRMVLDKFGVETAKNMRPYIVRYMEDYRDGRLEVSCRDATTAENAAPNDAKSGITLSENKTKRSSDNPDAQNYSRRTHRPPKPSDARRN